MGQAVNASSGEEAGSLADFASQLAGLILSEESVSGLLEIIVGLATASIPGVSGSSISLLRDGPRFETSNASSAQVRHIDESQYSQREGPCVEAIRSGQEVKVALPVGAWPSFSQRALEAGIHSVLSLPLRVRDRTTGALNLYSREESLTNPAMDAARALAQQAAVVMANAAALMSAELTNRHLREALESRDLIGQAKGILMARQGISADQAFDLLRHNSQQSGRKLKDLAAEIASGPGSSPRDRR